MKDPVSAVVKKTVLLLSASPRRDGNSARAAALLSKLLRPGLAPFRVDAAQLRIKPCTECGGCDRTGKCVIADGFGGILRRIDQASAVVFISPVFFMGIPAAAKGLVDRFQCRWVSKFVLGKRRAARPGFAVLLRGNNRFAGFDGVLRTVRAFMAVNDIVLKKQVLCSGIEKRSDIVRRTDCISAVTELADSIKAALR